MLYLMRFVLNFWEEIVSYKLGWQSKDGHQVPLPIHDFAQGVGLVNGVAMLAKFANTLPWGLKLLDEKLNVDDVSPPLEDMMRNHLAHVALSTCDLPSMWETLDQLEMAMDWCVLYKHNKVYHQHHNRYNIFAIVYSYTKGNVW